MRAPEQDPTPDCPQSGASRLRRSLPPDGYRSGSGLFADIGLGAHWPGDIGSLCRHWPLCPLAWGPRPAPGHDRAWFYPRCSPGLDALRRKSTRPLWDTWLEVTRMLPPAAAPSTGRQPDSRVTQIRGRAHACPPASVPTGLVASPLIWEKAVLGFIPTALSNSHASVAHPRGGRRARLAVPRLHRDGSRYSTSRTHIGGSYLLDFDRLSLHDTPPGQSWTHQVRAGF